MDHEAITKIMTNDGAVPYGTGIRPNPFWSEMPEWRRRQLDSRRVLTEKIESLLEPRFITPPETAECIEAIVSMTDSRKVLELGMCTGFTSLHILRAIVGKDDARLVSVEPRPAHDKEFFGKFKCFQHIEEWTPQALDQLHGEVFDLVFIDSDHSVEHTAKELNALVPITRPGTILLFHDVPEWQTPTNRTPPPVRNWLYEQVRSGLLHGLCLPSCEQMDCLSEWGKDYPKQANPGLGIFVRA